MSTRKLGALLSTVLAMMLILSMVSPALAFAATETDAGEETASEAAEVEVIISPLETVSNATEDVFGAEEVIQAEDEIVLANPLPILKPLDEEEFTVTYNANGGVGAPVDPNSYPAWSVVVVLMDEPTMVGYVFTGWAYGPTLYHGGGTFTIPAANVTLTAQWVVLNEETFTVTYNANGGVGAPVDGNAYDVGDTVTVLGDVPTMVGFIFIGWLYDGDLYIPGGTFTMPAEDVTLVAQWTTMIPNPFVSYTVHYYKEGTTESVAPSRVLTGQRPTVIVTESALEVTGWEVIGSSSQTLLLTANPEENIITFYYRDKVDERVSDDPVTVLVTPIAPRVLPQTGDSTGIWVATFVAALAVVGVCLIVLAHIRRKNAKN